MRLYLRRTYALVACFVAVVGPLAAETEPPVRLLTIGNSFAENAVKYLREFARAAGHEIQIREANLPSHSLEQHWRYVQQNEADPTVPAGRPYKGARGEPASQALVELLAAERWDFVTLQQVSHLSYKAESFQPHLQLLVDFVRQRAPEAEILLHQTWAYREDHALFREGFSSTEMAARIARTYQELARALELRVLPVGDAFEAVRQTEEWRFVFPDPEFDYEHPRLGSLPRQRGSLHRGWQWRKNRETGADELRLDAIHANAAGCYLAGAVWFEVIFKEDVTNNAFCPAELSAADAAFLRRAAHRAASASLAVENLPAPLPTLP